MAAFIIYGPQT